MVAITKGEFARRRGVSPGRVSQWLSEGKISGAAIIGEGRAALIDEVLACEQLGLRLDTGQRTGNGLKTNLTPQVDGRAPSPRLQVDDPAAMARLVDRATANGVRPDDPAPAVQSIAAPAAAAPIGEKPPLGDTVEQRLLQEKLEKAQRDNRQARVQEALDLGQLCSVAESRRAAVKEAQQLIIRVEGSLTEIASDLAAKFKLPARDVLHELRAAWRRTRQGATIETRERAEPMPERVAYELADSA